MKKRLSILVAIIAMLAVLAGCNSPTETPAPESTGSENNSATVNPEPAEPEPNVSEPAPVEISFSTWNGSWNCIVDYLDDPALDGAYAEVAAREEVDPSVIKERFKTRYATDLVAFTIEGDTLTLYGKTIDGTPNEADIISTNTYSFVAQFEENSTWNHFQANEADAPYPVLMMIEPGRDSETSVYHTHYRYGNDAQELLALEGYPTMVAADSTIEEIYEMIIG